VFSLQLETTTFYVDCIHTYNIGIDGKTEFIFRNSMIVNMFSRILSFRLCKGIPYRASHATIIHETTFPQHKLHYTIFIRCDISNIRWMVLSLLFFRLKDYIPWCKGGTIWPGTLFSVGGDVPSPIPLYRVRIRVWWVSVRVATQGEVSGVTTGGLGVKAASLSPPPPGRPTTCN
jgi:hypothetical protein